jgi:hypothetical protein
VEGFAKQVPETAIAVGQAFLSAGVAVGADQPGAAISADLLCA